MESLARPFAHGSGRRAVFCSEQPHPAAHRKSVPGGQHGLSADALGPLRPGGVPAGGRLPPGFPSGEKAF